MLGAALCAAVVASGAFAPAARAQEEGGDDSTALFWALGIVAVVMWAVMTYFAFATSRRRAARVAQVERAAAVAAKEDAAFSADAVRERAAELYREVHAAWDRPDMLALERLMQPSLFAVWRGRLAGLDDGGWRHHIKVVEVGSVRCVGLVNLEADRDDRVTVEIAARLRDYHVHGDGTLYRRQLGGDDRHYASLLMRGEAYELDDGTTIVPVGEPEPPFCARTDLWTLARSADGHGWVVAAIEQDVGDELLHEEAIVAVPESPAAAAHEPSEPEPAADWTPAGAPLHHGWNVRRTLAELAEADERWRAGPLEASLRRAVAAWLDAGGELDGELLDVATPEAARTLLHPDDPTGRLQRRIREAQVRVLEIAAVDGTAEPPRVRVGVMVNGRRHLADRGEGLQGIVTGDDRPPLTSLHRWTLARCGPPEQPWLVVAADTGRVAR